MEWIVGLVLLAASTYFFAAPSTPHESKLSTLERARVQLLPDLNVLRWSAQMQNQQIQQIQKKHKQNLSLDAAKTSENEVKSILERDQLCKLAGGKFEQSILFHALLDQYATSEERDFLSREAYPEGRPRLYSGLIEGVPKSELKLENAAQLLSELQLVFSENGALCYYQSLVFKPLGRETSEQRRLLEAAISAPDFDTYLRSSEDGFFERKVLNSSVWLASIELFSVIPVPRMVSKEYLEEMLKPETASERARIAEFGRLLANSAKTIPIENATGANIFSKFDDRHRKLARKQSRARYLPDSGINALNSPECRRELFDAEFEIAKEVGVLWM